MAGNAQDLKEIDYLIRAYENQRRACLTDRDMAQERFDGAIAKMRDTIASLEKQIEDMIDRRQNWKARYAEATREIKRLKQQRAAVAFGDKLDRLRELAKGIKELEETT